ncbi:MFS transporter [Sphaerisporangium sp. NPDC051017]|uniref:MFS transporter n=1 Tax=Sphaerisporangium sp. NPDC051017 TaxID=3154636 RepID=UPI00341B7EF1
MTSRSRSFLIANFISTLGDVMVVTAIPFGVGLETGRIENTIIFWLVPALAVLGASFFGKRISRRKSTARVDYARLLMGIAVAEVVISLLTLLFRGPISTLVISTLFVALYAFAKEGIPRILYQVAMYRYFVKAEEYARLAGLKAGLDIVAALGAILFSAAVVASGTWRYVLLFDALTFVVLSVTMWKVGRDPESVAPVPIAEKTTTRSGAAPDLRAGLVSVLIAIPLFHGVNAAFVNYLPLINQELGVMAASTSITLLAVLRAPGMLLGLGFDKIRKYVPARTWTTFLPVAYVLIALTYLASPNVWSVYALLFLGGLNVGVFAPSDAIIRNEIPEAHLVGFNVIVLRWLGVFQALACLSALAVFRTLTVHTGLLAIIVVASVVFAVLLPRIHANNPLLARPAPSEAVNA